MHDRVISCVFVLLFALVTALMMGAIGGADFLALWMAGEAVANGTPALIYPPDTTVFTMTPPPEWRQVLTARGHTDPVYPYIYAPIWAWLMAPVTQLTSFETANLVVRGVNGALLAGALLAARTLATPGASLGLWLGAGAAIFLISTAGSVALVQNQPQILVAFLTVLAIERAERGAPVLGGLLLALAAALKLYPALLALLWLARGQNRAFMVFVVAGGALAGLSVLLAGWPLHARFLELISIISNSVLSTPLSHTIDAPLALALWPQAFDFITDPAQPGDSGWLVMQKPAAFALFGKALQLATLAGLALMGRRGMAASAFWPLAMTLLSLTAPLAWSYHYLAPLAFAPALLIVPDRFLRAGVVLVAGLISMPMISLPTLPYWPYIPMQLAGSVGMALLAATFFRAGSLREIEAARPIPLRPGPGTL